LFSISNELPGFFLQSREIITDRLPFLKMGDFGNRPEINTPDRTEIPPPTYREKRLALQWVGKTLALLNPFHPRALVFRIFLVLS
jgi:hypothetical protein